MKTLLRAAVAASLACCAFAASAAGNYPTKPITLVVGYTAGGSVDLVARTVAPELGKRLGQSVVIENLGGAGGTIGAQKVVKADPDGYTLLMGSGSEVSIARLTNPAVRYDGEKDLAPITFVGTQPMVLVGKLQLPAKDAGELMALAKAQPGKLSYASSGVGTPLNLAGELIKQQGKVNITHVPYKGASAMSTDLLGGQIDLAVMVLSSALPHIQAGRIRAYGVTEAKRASVAPNVPALAETPALKGVDMGVWFGLMAPTSTPRPVIDRLNNEMQAVLAMPEVRKKLAEAGVEVAPANPAQFASFVKRETSRYRTIVQAADIRE
ncbi:tripartite tricarboxylate transporter substrate binding protein [Cupriavidus metallidurans]|uniref:Bug family tripartite tricarboxylate transporter substrate binding protein n=1 Tax=Cupriavidus TaxID=106589 RepID=UPI0002A3557E|nr:MULTISPECIES: tripartite tricarboxylate transporter substrate binding protein [unclassified Cupriavidus]EKZ96368.1 extra-cytoplasmic solute receptor protein [Cupriavidus sp. HMR-1]GMG91842.1 ABC transporter substrate-binding protein [Cupriavidus sp. TKC]HBD35639.1 tripartite tricarboxylate transporter substrate binding protein [Cupriavidus sp.]HBO79957.1 tripartite tricarboxylate transporter substrate binding protein [Cupriavidus sp.]